MFNLDEAITEWRRKAKAEGINPTPLLDELEGHLREDVEREVREGLSMEGAFAVASQRMGPASALGIEFKKIVETRERRNMKRTIIVSAGIIAILAGMAFVMPAVAQYRHEGAMSSDEVLLFVLGMALTLGGGGASFHGFRKRSA